MTGKINTPGSNTGTLDDITIAGGIISNAAIGVRTKQFGFSAYLSATSSLLNGTWTELAATWTQYYDTNATFATDTGRFTPTVAGIYHCGYVTDIDEIDDNERIIGAIRVNGTGSDTTGEFAKFQNRSPATNGSLTASASALIVLGTSDYVSVWAYQDGGGNDPVNINTTKFWGYYVGTE